MRRDAGRSFAPIESVPFRILNPGGLVKYAIPAAVLLLIAFAASAAMAPSQGEEWIRAKLGKNVVVHFREVHSGGPTFKSAASVSGTLTSVQTNGIVVTVTEETFFQEGKEGLARVGGADLYLPWSAIKTVAVK